MGAPGRGRDPAGSQLPVVRRQSEIGLIDNLLSMLGAGLLTPPAAGPEVSRLWAASAGATFSGQSPGKSVDTWHPLERAHYAKYVSTLAPRDAQVDAHFNCPDGVVKHADKLSGTGEIGEIRRTKPISLNS